MSKGICQARSPPLFGIVRSLPQLNRLLARGDCFLPRWRMRMISNQRIDRSDVAAPWLKIQQASREFS